MVIKQASPPIRFEIGSARNTPVTPISGITGSKNVSGTTMLEDWQEVLEIAKETDNDKIIKKAEKQIQKINEKLKF